MGDLLPFRLHCLCPPSGPHVCGSGNVQSGAAHAAHEPFQPRMYCVGCGRDRTVPSSAADPGPCPYCGSTMRSSTGKLIEAVSVPGVKVTITHSQGFGAVHAGPSPPLPLS